MADQQLMEYFEFDEADLFANRSDQFTEKQKARLVKADSSQKQFNLIAGIVLLVVGAAGLVAAIVALTRIQILEFRIGLRLAGIIWAFIWARIGVRAMRGTGAKFQAKLKKAEGPINIVKEKNFDGHATNIDYELHVGGKEFNVDSDLADIMMQGDVHAIYYTLGTIDNDILSRIHLKSKIDPFCLS